MFNNSMNIFLGAIAGLTIFLGLPIAKRFPCLKRMRKRGELSLEIYMSSQHLSHDLSAWLWIPHLLNTRQPFRVVSSLPKNLVCLEAGKGHYIEYQDARGFLQAAYELAGSTAGRDVLQHVRNDLEILILDDFPSIDPPNSNKPVLAQDVVAGISAIKKDLEVKQ